jgi:hypothetical protein
MPRRSEPTRIAPVVASLPIQLFSLSLRYFVDIKTITICARLRKCDATRSHDRAQRPPLAVHIGHRNASIRNFATHYRVARQHQRAVTHAAPSVAADLSAIASLPQCLRGTSIVCASAIDLGLPRDRFPLVIELADPELSAIGIMRRGARTLMFSTLGVLTTWSNPTTLVRFYYTPLQWCHWQ